VTITLPGQHTITMRDAQVMGIYEPQETDHIPNRKSITEALHTDDRLNTFLAGAKNLLIIINDATRPTPTPEMLAALLPAIEKAGLRDEAITLLVATGAHREAKTYEMQQLLGPYEQRLKDRVVSHDCRDTSQLQHIGTTRNGTPIVLNRLLFSADRILVTGSVEPHYFAGYTGGRKAFLPGIASYETITANHRLAIRDEARTCALAGNPVHEDMIDALGYIQAPVFSLMTVLDRDQKSAAATAGDINTSFQEAVAIAEQIFCVPIPEPADVVISVAKFPMDINLYQAQKAIDNGALAVKDGGTLILVASCREGIGDEEFARLLSSCSTPGEAIEKIQQGYRLGYHKAAKMAAVSQRITVKAFTDLDDQILESLFIQPVHNLQEALDQAGEHARILVLPDGCVTVPILQPEETYEFDI
jgi:nickel-dependent lactate racemase